MTDEAIGSGSLELSGANVATTFISCPADGSRGLGIKLPVLVLLLKNVGRYFSFEVQVRVARERRAGGGCGGGGRMRVVRVCAGRRMWLGGFQAPHGGGGGGSCRVAAFK